MEATIEYEYETQSSVIVIEAIPHQLKKLIDEMIPKGWEIFKLNDVFPVGEREAFYLIIFRRPKPPLQFQT
jgi:hypothetical protein